MIDWIHIPLYTFKVCLNKILLFLHSCKSVIILKGKINSKKVEKKNEQCDVDVRKTLNLFDFFLYRDVFHFRASALGFFVFCDSFYWLCISLITKKYLICGIYIPECK